MRTIAGFNLFELFGSIGIDTSNYEKGVKDAAESSETLSDKLKMVVDGTKSLAAKAKTLTSGIQKTKQAIDEMAGATKKSSNNVEETADATHMLAEKLDSAEKEANQLNEEVHSYSKAAKKAGDASESFGSKLKKGFSVAGKVIAGIWVAAGAAVGAVTSLDGATEDYRKAMGKLKTAYDAVNMSTDAANTAYTEFYKILGDTDTATEAAQLLSKLTRNEQDITKWTRIAAGVNGQWGDSLPIEALIESANETAKVGQVTGNLADALNWAGISEDNFNKKLANCSSESERNKLIMDTLSGAYDEASDAFYKNNQELVKQRENQAKIDASMAKVGEAVGRIKNSVVGEFLPAIGFVFNGIAGLLNGDTSTAFAAIEVGLTLIVRKIGNLIPKVAEFGLGIVFKLAESIIENLPFLIETGFTLLMSLFEGITQNAPTAVSSIVDVILRIVETLTQPESIILLVNAAMTMMLALAEGLIAAVPRLIEAIPTIISNLLTALAGSAPLIVGAGAEIIVTLISGIVEAGKSLIQAGRDIVEGVKGGFTERANEALTWGKDLVQNFINGIQAKWQALKDKVSNLAGMVKDYLGFSEPEKGPLSNFHTYAPDMMELFAKGIRDNEGMLTRQIESTFNLQPRIAAATAGGYDVKVNTNGGAYDAVLDRVVGVIRSMDWKITLDDGAVVGMVDNGLGKQETYERRGN